MLLDEALVPVVTAQLARGRSVDDAIRAMLAEIDPRCVCLPHLDVFDDPALRVALAVTSLQRGGAERVALDLARELPRTGIRPLLFTLGTPTRAHFHGPRKRSIFRPGAIAWNTSAISPAAPSRSAAMRSMHTCFWRRT